MDPRYHSERLQTPMGEDSAYHTASNRGQIPSIRTQVTSSDGCCRDSYPEECSDGNSSGRQLSRLLLTSIFSSQKRHHRDEDDNRFENPEQMLFAKTTSFHNGICQKSQEVDPGGRIFHQYRSERCLSACPDSLQIQEVSSICNKREKISVSSPSVRDIRSPMALHPPAEAFNSILSLKKRKNPRLHRRFPSKRQRHRKPYKEVRISSASLPTSWMDNPHGEIRPHSEDENEIHRRHFRLKSGESVYTQRKMVGDQRQNPQNFTTTSDINQELEVANRVPHLHSGLDSQGQTQREIHPTLDKSVQTSPVGRQHCLYSRSGSRIEMVVDRIQCHERSALDTSPSSEYVILRRLHTGMGSSLGKSDDSRSMDAGRERTPYQHSGIESSPTGGFSLGRHSEEFSSKDRHGQFLSGCILEQTGRNQVILSHGRDSPSVPSARCNQLPIYSETHSRQIEHPGGQPLQIGQDHLYRVDNPSGGVQTHLSSMGNPTRGSLCHQSQSQVANLRQPCTGSSSLGGGCLFNQVGQHASLCLSTNETHSRRTIQSSQGQSHDVSGCASLANSELVSDSNGTTSRPTTKASRVETPALPAQIRQISQERPQPTSSRLENIGRSLSKEGFSDEVSSAIMESIRPSTSRLYNAKWDVFQQWRIDNGIHLRHISIPDIANFLMYLRQEKKLKHGTLEGYRSAIASVCHLNNLNIGSSKPLSSLLRSFQIQDLTVPVTFPKWDLAIVLKSLTSSPYEPLEKAGLKFLSHKTAFLVTLATAARVSEIHAIDHNSITHSENWNSISCRTVPEFLAKNQKSQLGPLGHRFFTIPALSPELDRSDKQRLLCPVRALRWYLQQTSSFRRNRRRLFLSCHTNVDSEISKNTIASWLRKTIASAYMLSDKQIRDLKLCPHEIRALATSLASWKCVSVEQVVSSCQWKSANTFTRFYLRDIQPSVAGLCSLGPVVAAQTIASA